MVGFLFSEPLSDLKSERNEEKVFLTSTRFSWRGGGERENNSVISETLSSVRDVSLWHFAR